MKKALSFNDVLLVPKYSTVNSRKDVSLNQSFLGLSLPVPLIAANMDTICEDKMAIALYKAGAIGCLHRFMSIQDNVKMFEKVIKADSYCFGSIGLGVEEFERGAALIRSGCNHIVIDVANGASVGVVNQYSRIREYGNNWYKISNNKVYIIIGNFATAKSYDEFCEEATKAGLESPDAIKVGIGGGSNCSTRIVTGVGMPTLASVLEFKKYPFGPLIIADGGIAGSGEAAKCLGAGASIVMCGSLLAGTEETPGDLVYFSGNGKETTLNDLVPLDNRSGVSIYVPECLEEAKKNSKKVYRGSASKESYNAQGKEASHRAPEGVTRQVPYKGPVAPIIEEFAAGLKSSLSYLNAHDIMEFRENAEFVEITSNGWNESLPKG